VTELHSVCELQTQRDGIT